MTESFRSTPPDQQWSGANSAGNGYQGSSGMPDDRPGADGTDVGKAVLVGIVGGLISAAGFLVYRRLPEEQKERLHSQVRTMVQQRISELRQNFNI